jgi:short-subunit dehydrogenase
MNLDDRVALVTGASSGIGAATARALASEGAHVCLLARTEGALRDVADDVRTAGGTATVYPIDLADFEAVEALADDVERDVGTPDVIVNNAGAGRFRPIEETSPEEAMDAMRVPYGAAFAVTRAFVDGMIDRGDGTVVTVTSAAAYAPWPGATAYAAARWAMRGFAAALRADLQETGVGVLSVVAGEVDSPYFDHNPGSRERLPAIAKLFPTLTPEDVADAIVDGLREDRRTVIVPGRLAAVVWLHRLFPRLVDELVVRTGWQRSPREDWTRVEVVQGESE